MKTAIQELEDKLKNNLQWIVMNADYELMEKLFKEGIEKEKEQIIESYYEGHTAPYFSPNGNDVEKQAKEYYNQTYNQNK